MKEVQPRHAPLSNRWRKVVLTRLGITTPDKAINSQIADCWKKGYSFKTAERIIREFLDVR